MIETPAGWQYFTRYEKEKMNMANKQPSVMDLLIETHEGLNGKGLAALR